jgi:hypothetical protein
MMLNHWRILPPRAGPVIGMCMLLIGGAARANPVSIQVELYGLPRPSQQVTALTIPSSDVGESAFSLNRRSPNGSVSIDIKTNARQGVVTGSQAGLYAAPVSGGSPAAPVYWTAPYFSTGTGSVILTFSRAQSYFGLLWGSVDHGNTITLNHVVGNHVTRIATISGDDIYEAAAYSGPDGSQGYGGSYYVLLNDLGEAFNQIVLSSSVISFEAADIQYADATVTVANIPEPAAIAMLGAAVLILLVLRRRMAA